MPFFRHQALDFSQLLITSLKLPTVYIPPNSLSQQYLLARTLPGSNSLASFKPTQNDDAEQKDQFYLEIHGGPSRTTRQWPRGTVLQVQETTQDSLAIAKYVLNT